jgi:hypothetical protein
VPRSLSGCPIWWVPLAVEAGLHAKENCLGLAPHRLLIFQISALALVHVVVVVAAAGLESSIGFILEPPDLRLVFLVSHRTSVVDSRSCTKDVW